MFIHMVIMLMTTNDVGDSARHLHRALNTVLLTTLTSLYNHVKIYGYVQLHEKDTSLYRLNSSLLVRLSLIYKVLLFLFSGNKNVSASSGNRTRAARVAGEHSTTEPTMLRYSISNYTFWCKCVNTGDITLEELITLSDVVQGSTDNTS